MTLLMLTACGSDGDPQPEEEPRAETPSEVVAVIEKGECLDCHILDGRGTYEGPALNRVGARLSSDQIRRKVVNPASFPAAGYENLAGRMPTDFEERLTTEELDRLVDYLAQRQ
jgi:mono/diheme cytochrome c family protein